MTAVAIAYHTTDNPASNSGKSTANPPRAWSSAAKVLTKDYRTDYYKQQYNICVYNKSAAAMCLLINCVSLFGMWLYIERLSNLWYTFAMNDDASNFITIVDNNGHEKRQQIEYIIADVQGETVYVTDGGLRYIHDSLWAKRHQRFLLNELDRLPDVISKADIVIWDSMANDDTLLYYKHLFIESQKQEWLVVAVVKIRQSIKFLYNFHLQESGKVKGYHLDVAPEIWYLNPQYRKRIFGL